MREDKGAVRNIIPCVESQLTDYKKSSQNFYPDSPLYFALFTLAVSLALCSVSLFGCYWFTIAESKVK